MLNRQHEIPTSIKVEIINAARKWPFYFSQIYEVILFWNFLKSSLSGH